MASTRDINLLELAAYVDEQTTRVVDNLNNTAAHFVTRITDLPVGEYLTLNVLGVTESGAEYTMFTSLPMNQTTTYRQLMGPSVNCVPGIACRDFMPRRLKAVLTPSDTVNPYTYSFDLVLGVGG